MLRFFSLALTIILIVLGCIIAVDNYFYSIAFFSQKIKDLNIIELVMIPFIIFLFTFLGSETDKQKQKAELESGKLVGSALCQRLNISARLLNTSKSNSEVNVQYFITWFDTMSISTNEMVAACGSKLAAEELNKDCQRALTLKTMISPVLSNVGSLLAISKFVSKQSSWLQTFSGEKNFLSLLLR